MLSLNLKVKGRKETHKHVFKGIPLGFQLSHFSFHCSEWLWLFCPNQILKRPHGANESAENKELASFNLSETVWQWDESHFSLFTSSHFCTMRIKGRRYLSPGYCADWLIKPLEWTRKYCVSAEYLWATNSHKNSWGTRFCADSTISTGDY